MKMSKLSGVTQWGYTIVFDSEADLDQAMLIIEAMEWAHATGVILQHHEHCEGHSWYCCFQLESDGDVIEGEADTPWDAILAAKRAGPKTRTIWDLAAKAQAEVDKWPEWKRRAADEALVTPPTKTEVKRGKDNG